LRQWQACPKPNAAALELVLAIAKRDRDRERPLLAKPFDYDGLEKLLSGLLSTPK
jgi:hypothetical protein